MFKVASLCSAMLFASIGAGVGARAGAEESTIPNFMSANFGWQPTTFLDFEPIEGKVAPVGADPRPRGVGADGQPVRERLSDAENPNLKPWAAAQMRMHNDLVRNGHRAFNAQSRCWPGGVPGQLLFVAEPTYFIQTRKRSGSSGSGINRCAASISAASTAAIRSRAGSENWSGTTRMASW